MATDPKALGSQPAVPYSQVEESETYSRTYAQHRGLTKREFFAGCALMGAAANDALDETELAQRAVSASDALLAALAEGA
jgi:hypothetical protein